MVPKRKEKQGDIDVDIVGNDTWEQGLFCPLCGSCYTEKEAGTEERYVSMHGPQQTKIITGKKQNKKYYDKSGNLINDPDLIQEIQRGANVISYHEQLPGSANDTHYNKDTKRLIRSRRSER